MSTDHIPDGYHSVTPSLTVKDADAALKFYADAFGAQEHFRMPDPKDEKKLWHSEFSIGNSTMMLSSEFPEMGAIAPEAGKGGTFMIYVENVDESFATALKAGATEVSPLEDMFWGDRTGRVSDPHGYCWSLAQKVRDVSPDEISEAIKGFSERDC